MEDASSGAEAASKARRLVLLRFSGDVTTKAPPTRRRFLQRMARNVKDALKSAGIPHSVTRTHARLFVELEEESGQGIERLARVFGVQSLALVEERAFGDLDELVAAGVALERRDLEHAGSVRSQVRSSWKFCPGQNFQEDRT